MDGDSEKNEKNIGSENDLSDPGDLFQSARIRRSICISDEMDRIFLGNRFNFLFHVSPIFWLILFAKSK